MSNISKGRSGTTNSNTHTCLDLYTPGVFRRYIYIPQTPSHPEQKSLILSSQHFSPADVRQVPSTWVAQLVVLRSEEEESLALLVDGGWARDFVSSGGGSYAELFPQNGVSIAIQKGTRMSRSECCFFLLLMTFRCRLLGWVFRKKEIQELRTSRNLETDAGDSPSGSDSGDRWALVSSSHPPLLVEETEDAVEDRPNLINTNFPS